MANDEFWADPENNGWKQPKRSFSAIHLSMLFATAVVAIAVVTTPFLAEKTDTHIASSNEANYDNVVTGSVGETTNGIQRSPNFAKKQYVIRHSITQSSGEACVIFNTGRKTGSC